MTHPIAIILCLAAAAGCVDADLYADGKYACEATSGCSSGWFCLDGSCRDGFDHVDTRCGDCVTSTCTDEAADCGRDDACRALYACVAACPPVDPACRMGCEADAPDASTSPVYDALDRCRRGDCFDGCIGLGGLHALISDSCESCMVAQCADALRGCYGPQPPGLLAGDCERFRWCQRPKESKNPSTWSLCQALLPYPTLQEAVFKCETSTCTEACELGRLWQCVGNYDWPKPLTMPITTTFKMRDLLTQAPLGGHTLTVFTACLTTTPPAWEGIAPESGDVTVELGPGHAGGFDGCWLTDDSVPDVGTDGFLQGHMTSLWHWGRPIAGIEEAHTLLVPSGPVVQVLYDQVPEVYSSDASSLYVSSHDCTGTGAPNILVTAEQGGDALVGYPFAGGILPVGDSSPTGEYIFFTTPPGFTTIRAVRATDGVEVAAAVVELLPGTLHIVRLMPHTSATNPTTAGP